MKFMPVAGRKLWGGHSFSKVFGKMFYENDDEGNEIQIPACTELGESWELADMGFIESVVSEGWLAGNELDEIMETYLERIVGEHNYGWYGRQFPLLVKILDIKDKISLQVHPDDEIAEQRYDMLGKKCLWYIMDVKPGAKIYMGLKESISAQDLWTKCQDGSIVDSLRVIEPKKGDAFLLKPGMMFSAEGGILALEIQESSDLSFRLYDWGRQDEDGTRDILLEEAFDFIDLEPSDLEECWIKGPEHKDHDCHCHEEHEHFDIQSKIVLNLCKEPEFTVNRINLTDPLHIYTEKFGSFIIYFCAEGAAVLQVPKQGSKDYEAFNINKGETILVPADMPDFFIMPRDKDTILIEAMVEERNDLDEYIDPSTEPFLEGEDYEGLEDDDHECCCHHDHDKC